MYKLFARPGWGAAIVELQPAWHGRPYTIENVDDPSPSAAAYLRGRARPAGATQSDHPGADAGAARRDGDDPLAAQVAELRAVWRRNFLAP